MAAAARVQGLAGQVDGRAGRGIGGAGCQLDLGVGYGDDVVHAAINQFARALQRDGRVAVAAVNDLRAGNESVLIGHREGVAGAVHRRADRCLRDTVGQVGAAEEGGPVLGIQVMVQAGQARFFCRDLRRGAVAVKLLVGVPFGGREFHLEAVLVCLRVGLATADAPVGLVVGFLQRTQRDLCGLDLLERTQVARQRQVGPHAALECFVGAFVAGFLVVGVDQAAGHHLDGGGSPGSEGLDSQVARQFLKEHAQGAVGHGVDLGPRGVGKARVEQQRPRAVGADRTDAVEVQHIGARGIADRRLAGGLPGRQGARDAAARYQGDVAALDRAVVEGRGASA